MANLLHTLLSNAAVAGLLALFAGVVTWRARSRPALAYALWLLVLLKLLTPPLVSIPVGWTEAAGESAPPEETDEMAVCPSLCAPIVAGEAVALVDAPTASETPEELPAGPPVIEVERMVLAVWLAGSVVFALVACRRIGQLVRLLAGLPDAPAAWQERVDRLAGRLGLRRSPRVRLSPVSLPPLVVSLGGRGVLVFPGELWQRLGDDQRDAVLLHELAHLRRRDHLVRLVELFALGLYWWFPVAWWASRRMRQAEEECCDVWVVWASPEARPAYAAALVETVAFLSGDPSTLPLGASGIGPVVALKRRLSMILQGNARRGLSPLGKLMMLGCLTLLPLMPTLAQSQADPQPPRAETNTAPTALDGILQMRSCRSCHEPAKKAVNEKGSDKLHTRIVELLGDLDRQRSQVKKTEKQLQELVAEFERAARLKKQAEFYKRTGHPRTADFYNRLSGPGKKEADKIGPGQPPPKEPHEEKLDRLLREVEELKREIRGTKSSKTDPPVIRADLSQQDDRTWLVRWHMKGTNLDIHTAEAAYRLEGEQVWQKLASENQDPRLTLIPGSTSKITRVNDRYALDATGEMAFRVADGTKVAEMRLRVKDKRGNLGEVRVKLNKPAKDSPARRR